MKEFEFNLEKVLKVRNIKEKMAQREFYNARQQAEELRSQIEQLNSAQKRVYNHLRKKSEIDPNHAIQARRFLRHNRGEIESVSEDLSEQEKVVENKRKRLKERAKKRQAMEKLKENKAEKYYKEVRREEQKKIDDITQFQSKENESANIFSG